MSVTKRKIPTARSCVNREVSLIRKKQSIQLRAKTKTYSLLIYGKQFSTDVLHFMTSLRKVDTRLIASLCVRGDMTSTVMIVSCKLV